MDTGQATFGVASLRMGRDSYRDRGMDVFSWEASSWAGSEENDEEALMWAALEKLPTITRVRKGINTAGGKVVDIVRLGFQDRRHLLERLVCVAEEDHEQFPRKLRKRLDRVGLDFLTIEVRYEPCLPWQPRLAYIPQHDSECS